MPTLDKISRIEMRSAEILSLKIAYFEPISCKNYKIKIINNMFKKSLLFTTYYRSDNHDLFNSHDFSRCNFLNILFKNGFPDLF